MELVVTVFIFIQQPETKAIIKVPFYMSQIGCIVICKANIPVITVIAIFLCFDPSILNERVLYEFINSYDLPGGSKCNFQQIEWAIENRSDLIATHYFEAHLFATYLN